MVLLAYHDTERMTGVGQRRRDAVVGQIERFQQTLSVVRLLRLRLQHQYRLTALVLRCTHRTTSSMHHGVRV